MKTVSQLLREAMSDHAKKSADLKLRIKRQDEVWRAERSKHEALKKELEAHVKSRKGYKPYVSNKDQEDYFEPGRSAAPSKGPGYYPGE